MISSLSDAALSAARQWVTWLAIGGSLIGVICSVLTFLLTRESNQRSAAKLSGMEATLADTQKRLAPRSLKGEQRAQIVAALAKLPEKPEIFIAAGILDQESMSFGEDIEATLREAGFGVHFPKEFSGDASISIGPPGIHLVVKDATAAHPLAASFQRCFRDGGLSIPGIKSSDPAFPPDRIEIAIWQK